MACLDQRWTLRTALVTNQLSHLRQGTRQLGAFAWAVAKWYSIWTFFGLVAAHEGVRQQYLKERKVERSEIGPSFSLLSHAPPTKP